MASKAVSAAMMTESGRPKYRVKKGSTKASGTLAMLIEPVSQIRVGRAIGLGEDLALDADAALGNVAGALHEAPSGYRSPRRSAGAVARKCEGRPVLRGGLCKIGIVGRPG